MKILFFTRRFHPDIGGVEKHILRISNILTEQGHQVTVISERTNQDYSLEETLGGIKIIRIPYLLSGAKDGKAKKWLIWKWLYKNRYLIKKSDIVHCHDVFYWYPPFRLLYPTKPIFTTFHGWEGIFPPRWQAIALRRLSERLSNGTIAIGQFITKWYGQHPDTVIYGGADWVNQNTRHGKYDIFYHGRLDSDTGLPTFLKSLALLRQQEKPLKVAFAGNGSLIETVKKHGTYLGALSYDDTVKIIASCRFCVASGYLSILDSLAAGCLVFAFADNLLKEDYFRLTPFTQCLMICQNERDFASHLCLLLNNKERYYELSNYAQSLGCEYTWEKVTDSYKKLWRIK